MADLDDFFAKRDKSKKSKKKFDTAEDLAKVLDQKVKDKKKLETGKSNYLPEGGRQSPGPGLPVGDDDEWLEAEEKKPDFSNLKIQELVLESDEDEDPTKENEEGTEGGSEGPWNKKTKDSKAKDEEKDAPKEEPTTTEEPAKPEQIESEEAKPVTEEESEEGSGSTEEPEKDNKYVPPSLRNKKEEPAAAAVAASASASAPASAPKAYVPPSRRGAGGTSSSSAPSVPFGLASSTATSIKKKGAPTLEDEESFPSLS